jgi:hypothetical protein
LAFAPSSLILANNYLPLNEALGIQGVSVSDKIPCKQCSTLVLPSTADKNEGLCMPCKKGMRQNFDEQKKQKELEIKRNRNIYNLLKSNGLISINVSENILSMSDISDFLKKVIPERVVELQSIETGFRDLNEHGTEYEEFFHQIANASNDSVVIESINTKSPLPSEDDEVEMMDIRVIVKSNKGSHKFKFRSYYEFIVFYKILSWSKKVLGNNVMYLGNEDFSIYCLPKKIIKQIEWYGVKTVSPRQCVGSFYWLHKAELIFDSTFDALDKLKRIFNKSS